MIVGFVAGVTVFNLIQYFWDGQDYQFIPTLIKSIFVMGFVAFILDRYGDKNAKKDDPEED